MKGMKMKKMMLVAAAIALGAAQINTAKAGDREWATAGKILTGVAIGTVVASAVNTHANYSVTYSAGPAYCPPPVVYAPPPRVIVAPAPVFCAPPPVVVYRPAVVCAPPVRYVRFDRHYHGHGHYGRHHGRHGRH
jgi:hypothetical protein